MGGILKTGGQVVSTAASLLGDRKSETDYYNSLAQDADRQANYTAQAARRQATYLFKSAAERGQELYDTYRQTAASQKTALAASGLTSRSATVQTMLKNSRFNALMDQESLQESLRDALYENDLAAAERIYSLTKTASQYRTAAQNRSSWWKLGNNILSLFN